MRPGIFLAAILIAGPAGAAIRANPLDLRIPDGRVARPEQVAAAAAYLLSPDAEHVAFHDLFVDGGESLGA